MEARIEKLEAAVSKIQGRFERIDREKSEAMTRYVARSQAALHIAIGFDIGLFVAIIASRLSSL